MKVAAPARRRPTRPLPRPSRTEWLTAPNLLTLARLPLAALVWAAPAQPLFVLAVVAAAAVTDILDGWVARLLKSESETGEWLDPICDKTFLVSVLAAVTAALRPPLWMPLLVAAREIVQIPLVAFWKLRARPTDRLMVKAALPGKAATVAQFAAIVAILLHHRWRGPLSVAAGVLGTAAAVYYLGRAVRGGVKGPCSSGS